MTRWRAKIAVLGLPLMTSIAYAQGANVEPLICQGVLPSWTLSLDETQGRLTTAGPVQLPVMNITKAEGRTWPKALTLVGDQDTAIVIVTPQDCTLNETAYDHHVLVLTQQDNQPILLTGCCHKAPRE